MNPFSLSKPLLLGVTSAVVLIGVTVGVRGALAADTEATGPAAAPAVAAEDTADGSLYEDFAYPDAARYLTEQHVKLISGDGRILIADCSEPPVGDIGLLKVYTDDEQIGADGIGRICFKVTAPTGVLSLEVPGVYEIRGDGQKSGTGHAVTAKLETDDGKELNVPVDPDGSTQVGLGQSPDNPRTMLLRLVVTG